MLQKVIRPDKKEVGFEYDALGRRTAKIFDRQITRWVWDGNTPLHEWKYELSERPKIIVDEFGDITTDKAEPTENLISWIFDDGSFKPAAKIEDGKLQSIITDYLGTPVEMFDKDGNQSWSVDYDIYGKIRKQYTGSANDCPFRYQGQYEDTETGLYYNRFRYYNADEGIYISQDPIGLKGGEKFYSYVYDTNCCTDILGLTDCFRGGTSFKLKPGEYKVTPDGKYPARGLSVNGDPSKVRPYGGAHLVTEIPEGLQIIHTPSKANPEHHDIIPKNPSTTSEAEFQALLDQIKTKPE